ncbi:MAG: histidinol-phosphate transaminase [Pseudomonadota bacterium]
MQQHYLHLVPEYIRAFEPYIPSPPDPELCHRFGVDHLIRLNSNENFCGPVDEVAELLRNIDTAKIPTYPSGDSYYLRHALGEKFDKQPEQFLIGNGSNEAITCLIKAFCESGDNIVAADRTYAVYEWVATFSGYEARLVPLQPDFSWSPDDVFAAIDNRTKAVFLCNPNNPTGKYWDRATLIDFLNRVDGRCVVVVDEAYSEYVDQPDYPDGMQLMQQYPNLVVFRTFSKMYGLASLRIGYLCASPQLIDLIRKTYVVYSVNTLAQRAAETALTHDRELIETSREMVKRGKRMVEQLASRLGLETISGEGNYIMLRAPMPDTLLYKKMLRRGIVIRPMTAFRLPGWVRITLQPEPMIDDFCQALESVINRP